MKHRIPNSEYLGVEVLSRDFVFYDATGPYKVHARAHRLYKGLPAKRPSDKPIKINKKTNAFWVYDTDQRELIPDGKKIKLKMNVENNRLLVEGGDAKDTDSSAIASH